MNTALTLLLLALGLSMDAFAVSVSNTMCYRRFGVRHAIVSSACFGVFQGAMPVIGFFAGTLFGHIIKDVDHWVALVLLAAIGGKMIFESAKKLREGADCAGTLAYSPKTMLVQAVATSIDALAVGISLAALSMNIWHSATVIAGITFAVCLVGCGIGKKVGAYFGDWAGITGGVILVGIGVKIAAEHLCG